MAENLLQPDSAASMPGGTTAAENLTGGSTPGAGGVSGTPTSNDAAPGNPTVTGPGTTGGTPTGGGRAVPDDAAFQNGDTLGDADSMDDGGVLGGDTFPGNQGAQPPTPGATNTDAGPGPAISETGTDASDDGSIATGGLSGGGTTGGVPTGGVDSGSSPGR